MKTLSYTSIPNADFILAILLEYGYANGSVLLSVLAENPEV
jgi:hypothetical protein